MTRADLAASWRSAATAVGGIALAVAAVALLHLITYLGVLMYAVANGATS